MKLVIREVNLHSPDYQLNEKHYSPYSNRVGRTTDACRDGDPEYMVMALGRWQTDIWRKTYLSTNFVDISKLSGILMWTLRLNAAAFVQILHLQQKLRVSDSTMASMAKRAKF